MLGDNQLVPPNSTPLEIALDRDTPSLPVPIDAILDPASTPAGFLPFLAAHEGVRLWFSDWPEARKREIIADWRRLASLIGTRAAAVEFLRYVDATIIDKVTHPRRFVIGRAAIGLTPINHRPWVTHLLVKARVEKPARAFVIGRAVIGRAALREPDDTILRRSKFALALSKAPETLISVNFGYRRPLTLDDGFNLDEGIRLGSFMDRKRL